MTETSLRVLIVEDDEDSAFLMGETLTERGHGVRVVHEANDALDAVTGDPALDVIVLDIGLPDVDGYELVQRIRTTPGLSPTVRLIALTGYGGDEDRERSKQAGFDVHLTKPISPDVLWQLVEDRELQSERLGRLRGVTIFRKP